MMNNNIQITGATNDRESAALVNSYTYKLIAAKRSTTMPIPNKVPKISKIFMKITSLYY